MLSLKYSLKNGSIVYWGQQKVSPQGIVLCIKISVLSSLLCNISNDTNKKGLVQIVPVLVNAYFHKLYCIVYSIGYPIPKNK